MTKCVQAGMWQVGGRNATSSWSGVEAGMWQVWGRNATSWSGVECKFGDTRERLCPEGGAEGRGQGPKVWAAGVGFRVDPAGDIP